jgi:hypothetical protein
MKFPQLFSRCCALGGLIVATALTSCTTMQPGPAAGTKQVDWLFVQNSSGLSASKDRIVLRGVNPQTICFSDRPDRVAGHMATTDFVLMWSQGSDSFLKDPPNATLSVIQGGKVESAVVTLRNPRLTGGDLAYDVTVLEGVLPARSGASSLFIDVIGMPCTPASYVGVARRTAYRGAAAYPVYAPAVVHYGAYGSTAVHQGTYGTTAVHHGAYGTTAVHRR